MNLRRIYDTLGIVFSVAIAVAFFYGNGERIVNADTRSYIEFADILINGDILARKDFPRHIDWARAARTPGYPLVIVAAKFLFEDFVQGIFILHLLIAALVIIFVSLVLRPWLPTIVTGLIIVAAEIHWAEYYYLVLTEWVAIHMLIALIGILVIVFRTPSNRNVGILALFITVLVLVRPAALPVFGFIPLVLLYRRRLDIGGVLMIVAAIAPLLLWMGFNKVYLGSFSITVLSGHSWLGIASLIGHAESEQGDSENLKLFIEMFNARKIPAVNAEERYISGGDGWAFQPQLNYNVYGIGGAIVRGMRMPVAIADREIFTPYGKRVILSHPDRYARYIWYGVKAGLSFVFPLFVLFLLAIPALCIYRKKNQMLASIAILFCGLHLVNLLFVSMLVAVYIRYVDFTIFPYLTAIAFAGFGLLFAELADTRFVAAAPDWIRMFFPASAVRKN